MTADPGNQYTDTMVAPNSVVSLIANSPPSIIHAPCTNFNLISALPTPFVSQLSTSDFVPQPSTSNFVAPSPVSISHVDYVDNLSSDAPA